MHVSSLIDVQSQTDDRRIDLDQVGVSGVRFPITVLDRSLTSQNTVANLTMSVGLSHHFKGTHMSRFLEVLHEHRGEFTVRTLPHVLEHLRKRLEAETARIEVEFPYFVERVAPASGAKGLLDFECWFRGELKGAESDFLLGVRVPVTSLCPCSKAISDYGAHNQRGEVTIEIRPVPDETGIPILVWIEELIAFADASASAPVYSVLKRDDERFVTMQAYDNPVFVEDIVRNVAHHLSQDDRIAWFRVHTVNHESIHNHGAFAQVERWVRPRASV